MCVGGDVNTDAVQSVSFIQYQRIIMRTNHQGIGYIMVFFRYLRSELGSKLNFILFIALLSSAAVVLSSTSLFFHVYYASAASTPSSTQDTGDPPTIKVPSNKVVEATGKDGASVTYSVSATDLSGSSVAVNCDPPSKSAFPIGTTKVICSVNGGNNEPIQTKSFSITVRDTTPPDVLVPSDLILEATGPMGRVVNYNSNATDIVYGSLPTICNPQSGSTFALGQTKVKCSATDSAGNTGTNDFIITIRDTTPPETTLENVSVGWLGSINYGDTTPSNDVNFNFNGTDLVGIARYECKFDDGSWQNGKSIINASGIKNNICTYTSISAKGIHNFLVRAVDTSGNKDPHPPKFTWEIESPITSVQDLIPHLSNNESTVEMVTQLNEVVKTLSDTTEENDAKACYQLDSFINSMKINILTGVSVSSDFDSIFKSTLAIKDNLGCPPPIADAGLAQSIDAGTDNVILDGSDSLYKGNDVSFKWEQVAGTPKVTIKNANTAKASFDAPSTSELTGSDTSTTLSFQLTVSENGGLRSTDITTVEIYTENTPPVAKSQSVTTTSDTPVSINLDASDKDGDTLTYAIKSFPAHGSLSSLDKDSGSVTYSPDRGYTGSDSFTFTASDGSSTSNTAKVSITVNSITPINTPPVAISQNVSTRINTPVSINLDASDKDGDTLTYAIKSFPTHGSLSSLDKDSGSVTYSPDRGYTGSDSFTFTASDGSSTSNTAKVSITVNSITPINTPPVAKSQSVTTSSDTPVSINLDASDKDGDTLTYAIKSFPTHGSLSSLDKDSGSVTYSPDRGYTGSDSFTFTASDGSSTSNTAKVSITVNSITPINTPPVAKSQSVTTSSDTPVSINLDASDKDGDTLTYA